MFLSLFLILSSFHVSLAAERVLERWGVENPSPIHFDGMFERTSEEDKGTIRPLA
jgi:hypothetical protein